MSDSWRSDVQNPVTRWVFITGNRIAVSAVLALAFVALTALSIELGLIHTGPGSNVATALSSGMLSGLLTLITVALSVNQLILSRLFGSAGDLSDQLEGTLEYRRTVEEIADVPISPNEPNAFLGLLGDTLERRIADFQRDVDDTAIVLDNGDDAAAYATGVTDYADSLSTAPDLDHTYKVLLLTLGTEYADHLDTTRELRAEYGEDFSAATTDAIDDALGLLKAVATMRQLFKTLTLQQELAELSRWLIYTGVPAILLTYLLSQTYTADPEMATAIDPAYMPLIVTVSTGIILLPLAVLVAYLLRVATVSLYTVSVGTFIPPKESI